MVHYKYKGLITQWLECTPDKREVGSSSLPKPTMIRVYFNSGIERFELSIQRTKNVCLTIWLYSIHIRPLL